METIYFIEAQTKSLITSETASKKENFNSTTRKFPANAVIDARVQIRSQNKKTK